MLRREMQGLRIGDELRNARIGPKNTAMVVAKMSMKRESAAKNQAGGNNGAAMVGRTNCKTAAEATDRPSLELASRAIRPDGIFTSRDHRRRPKSRRRYPYHAELFSFAAESQCDVAKAVVAIVEMAKAGTDRFGYGGLQMRIRCAVVMRRGASVGTPSIPTARPIRGWWGSHASQA